MMVVRFEGEAAVRVSNLFEFVALIRVRPRVTRVRLGFGVSIRVHRP